MCKNTKETVYKFSKDPKGVWIVGYSHDKRLELPSSWEEKNSSRRDEHSLQYCQWCSEKINSTIWGNGYKIDFSMCTRIYWNYKDLYWIFPIITTG